MDIKTDPDTQAGRKFSAPIRNPTENHRTSFCSPYTPLWSGQEEIYLVSGLFSRDKTAGK
jgi:hypothetical protein